MPHYPGFAPAKTFPPHKHPQSAAQPVAFPQGWKPQAAPAPQTAWPKPTTAQQGFKPPLLARAKTVDEDVTNPASTQTIALSLPSPAALGIAPAAPLMHAKQDVVDWNATRARLNQLGAVSFNMVRLTGGSYRMVVTLPTADPKQHYLVEVVADSEAVAITTALDRAEQWIKR